MIIPEEIILNFRGEIFHSSSNEISVNTKNLGRAAALSKAVEVKAYPQTGQLMGKHVRVW